MEKGSVAYGTALEKVIELLEEVKLPYMLVGGVAVGYYGFPRATLDVDVLLELEPKEVNRFISLAKKRGFDLYGEEIEALAKVGNRFVALFGDRRVDFWLAKTTRERGMLENRCRVRLLGRRTWLCSLDDLILSKLEAGRAKDIDDVLGILIRKGNKLKKDALMSKARESDLAGKLDELMRRAEKIAEGK
jgi:predicted nucleotidyltransferase